MKKITLTLTALLAVFTMNSQITNISFETSEGFTEGTLDSQNEWGTSDVVADQFFVSDNYATDGSLSLYGEHSNEQYDNGQGQAALIGAFSPNYTITSSLFSISMDVYVTTPVTENNGSDIHLGAQSSGEEFLTSRVVFDFQSNIKVIDDASGSPAYENIGTYEFDTWYNVEVIYDFDNGTIEYYLDDTLAYTGNVWTSATTVDQLTFLFDNYESSFYVDNVVINDGNLSTRSFETIAFDHYLDNNSTLVLSSDNVLSGVKLYSILGQEVLAQELNATNGRLDISSFNAGVYLAQVQIEGQTKTFKFIKK
ncbi:T9SS type A sorting domain-containing protein [Mesonia sp.]|uniref:T9SS type A sorting domain-containing protein n=1 Tax=Mesonia sp. TaxID=1960830 RepID=UPI0017513B6A|nr:T9SS type A sorting domain-containing protein [Mesonia sp.]HIB37642.1 T9SS type A sorting domain-containing protein [Mesonia sp.]HIO26889.1 T9SS type A sorting domain-containing protein [Flavobacteriaceae bacterium]